MFRIYEIFILKYNRIEKKYTFYKLPINDRIN